MALLTNINGKFSANYVLKTNGSGTVSWSPDATGTVTGSGTDGQVTYWTSATNVTSDTGFTYNGAGRVSSNESFGVSKDGADTVVDGPFFVLRNAAGTRQYANQLDASNNIDYWYYNGSTWTQTISLLNNGGATFTGDVTVNNDGDGKITVGGTAGLEIIHNNAGNTIGEIKQLYAATSNAAQLKLTGGFTTFYTGTSGTERMRIDSNGDISMTEGLAIQKMLTIGTNVQSGSTNFTIRNYDGSLVTAGSKQVEFLLSGRYWSGGTSQLNFARINLYSENGDGYGYGGALGFDTGNGAEKMRITSGGEVLIRRASSTDTTFSLQVGDGVDDAYRPIRCQVASTGTRTQIGFYNTPTAEVGTISTSGTSTSYNTTSDYRLKEDLQDFAGLDMVSKIPVYDFKWKTDESRSYGVMAHELQEVLPDAVSGEKDAEEMQGVDYSKIVPILIKSIQELKAEIEILKNK